MTERLIECDDRLLLAALRSGDDELQQPLARHVEQCAHCQARLVELAATKERWQKAAAAFSDGDQRLQPIDSNASPREINRWTGRSISWNEAMVRQLLDPPSHPEMLGRLGRYEIERLVGSGGMGIVFKAHDTELNRPVAIKMLAPYLASGGSARKRFAREARSAAGIVNDHVVPIHNVESDSDHPFLVMQYVAGGSLQEKLDRCGPLGVAEIVRIGLQAAKGLAAAHAQGLIHRDVKPSNILLDEGVERALLTDFGLARTEDDACLTRSGFQPGTPHYMSPEQVRGVPHSETTGVGEPADSATPADQLHGSWRAIPMTDGSNLVKSLTFYRDRVGVLASGGAAEGIVVFPETDATGAIDFVWQQPDKDPVPISRGLYEIREGVLWLRMAAERKPRPKDLETDQPGTTFQKYTREWIRSDLPKFDPSRTLELQRWAINRKGAGVETKFNIFVPGRKWLLEAESLHAPMAPTYELADIPSFGDTTFTIQLFLPNLSPRGMEFLARNSITMTVWPNEFMAARESKRVVKAYFLSDTADNLKVSSLQHSTLTIHESQTEWLRELDREGDVLVIYELARGRLPNIEPQDNSSPNAGSVSDDYQPSDSSPADDRDMEGYVRGTGHVVALVPQEEQRSVNSPVPDTSELVVELWISGIDAPLVQRGDRVRLQFEGWPPAEPTGSFGGKVMSIDPTVDDEGKLRILVQADSTESWPDKRYLRAGVRATGWILTGDRSTNASQSKSGSTAVSDCH